MSDGTNFVELRGQVRIFKTGRSKVNDSAWARGSVKAGKLYVNVKAFNDAAEALGNAADLTVSVTGHLEGEKPEGWDDLRPEERRRVKWPLVVVVDRVHEHAPGEKKGNAPKAQDSEEIPF